MVKRYTVLPFNGIPRYASLGLVHGTGRIGNGTITVRIRFYLKELFCFNWHRIRFVYKSAGSKQLCTIKIVVYLGVSDIQNTNLGQLCSLYCMASILKVFKDHRTGYVVRSEEIRDFFQCKFIVQRSNNWVIYFRWTIYLIAQWTSQLSETKSLVTLQFCLKKMLTF